MESTNYTIRFIRSEELPFLPTIEQAAAIRFLETDYAYLAEDAKISPLSAQVDLDHDFVWVVCDTSDQPVGFAIAYLHEDSVFIYELDVHPDHARKGLGCQLIETIAVWAREKDAQFITLTTFDNVPWNGPYYERLGFRTLDSSALSPFLQKVLQDEQTSGLLMHHRICMQLDLAKP